MSRLRDLVNGRAVKRFVVAPHVAASQDRPGRQITTFAAHLVFGATLGWLLGLGPTD